MIVKNEEALLNDCLASVKSVADEVIVVDTGSDDKTVEIAESHGARIFTIEWTDDFSAARNFSLEQAKGNWILVVDADEHLAEEDLEKVRNWISKKDVDVVNVKILNEGGTFGRLPRLFRTGRGLHYQGRVHEQLVFSSGEKPVKMFDSEVRLYHVGYNPQVISQRSKIERNLALLNRILEDSPKDIAARYHLACTLQYACKYPEALRKWDEVMQIVSGEELAEAIKNRAICLFEVGPPKDALLALNEAVRAFPDEVSLHVRLAQLYQATGDLTGLRREIRILTKLDPEDRNLRVVRAILYFREESYYQSGVEFAKLLVDYPDEPLSYVNLAHVLILSGDMWEALSTLEEGVRCCGSVDVFVRPLLAIKGECDPKLLPRLDKLFEKFPVLSS